MNKWIGMGRLVRDPEVKYGGENNSMAIARFSIAVDRRGKKNADSNEPTADFINCVAFSKTAEFVEKYCTKGTKLVVEGHIQTGSYVNKEGNKVFTTDIMVDNLEFAESKAAASGGGNSAAPKKNDDFMSIPDGADDALPFN